MYIRTVKRRTRTSDVSYVQLAHNEWDPAKKRSVPKVVHSFGRADQVDEAGLRRLIASLKRYLGDTDDTTGTSSNVAMPEPVDSRPAGGALVLDGVWKQLGLDQVITRSGQKARGRKRDLAATERILFSLVANRALAPSSKLAAAEWMNHDTAIPDLADAVGAVDEDACYRVMDWLIDAGEPLERAVYEQVADLLNLEVDLLFFDTTSTYFETEDADTAVWRDETGQPVAATADAEDADAAGPVEAVKQAPFRTFGKSKDYRDDLPQVVIGLAVTREAIPVRVWCWPGNTADSALIRQVRADMRDWTLSRIIYTADRGFTSKANRRDLMRGGDGYILGEKLRSNSADARVALSRPGKYRTVKDNLRVKEVTINHLTDAADRFIVCLNPEQAGRDAHTRAALIARLEEMIAGSDALSPAKRGELKGRISTMPGLNRFLRSTKTGLLRIDQDKIKQETNLDGKYLLRTSDPHMSAEDVALGYKQLLEVERGWRDMKSTLDLRPVYHRLEHRIRAHVQLCWLALLLIRIIENTTGQTWNETRRIAQRLHQVTLESVEGTMTTLTRPTTGQAEIFTQLGLPAPRQVQGLTPATT